MSLFFSPQVYLVILDLLYMSYIAKKHLAIMNYFMAMIFLVVRSLVVFIIMNFLELQFCQLFIVIGHENLPTALCEKPSRYIYSSKYHHVLC